MSLDPFAYFAGREREVAAFEALVSPNPPRQILLISGLSGTGKSFLIDWLRQNRTAGIPNAKLTLAPAFQETDVLRSLATQIDPLIGADFAQRLDELTEKERQHPLVNVPVNQRIESRFGGGVSDADQHVVVNLGQAGAAIELQRRIHRLDALMAALRPIIARPWVLFIDEAEHLAYPDLRRFILDELVARLRAQSSGCRLYFSGQSAPVEAFSSHEFIRLELTEFTVDETAAMAAKAGLVGLPTAEKLRELSGGHPLLLSMCLEDALAPDEDDEEDLVAKTFNEGDRTRWIYDRVVRRLPDQVTRKIAANLCLLEWFDLGLLRSVFNADLSEEAFDEMVNRSFIKPLGGGRWRCHDMIRKHLPAQRRAIDPEECVAICRRAADAFLEKLVQEEERTGRRNFPERLSIVGAAMHSMLGFSRARAESFIYLEIAHAIAANDFDFLYAIARELERLEVGTALNQLATSIKEFLESMNALHFDAAGVGFVETFAEIARKENKSELASVLFYLAGTLALAGGDSARAQALADLACVADNDLTGQILRSRTRAQAGDSVSALAIIEEARQTFGDSAPLRLGEVLVARDLGEGKRAVRLLTDLIVSFPDKATPARLQLAQILLEDDRDGALKQLETLLEGEPDHVEALGLKADILVSSGQFQEAMSLIDHVQLKVSDFVSNIARLAANLAQPDIRNRLLAQFKNDPSSGNPGMLLGIADELTRQGDFATVTSLVDRIENVWPETRDAVTVKRATLLLASTQVEQVPPLLEPLVARGVFNGDLYATLSNAYGILNQPDQQRATLEQGMKRVPWARDIFESQLVDGIAKTKGVREALRYLSKRVRDSDDLGPYCLVLHARLLAEGDKKEAAIGTLDRLIHTRDTDQLPRPVLIAARLKLAALLADKDQTRALHVLDKTVDLFPDDASALLGAAKIFASIGDETRLRDTLRACKDRRATTKMEIIALLSRCILARQPDVSWLLEELKRHPDRLELFAAIDATLTTAGRFAELPDVVSRIEVNAPGLIAEFLNLRNRYLVEVSGSIEEIRKQIELTPDKIAIRLAAADLLKARGALDEALKLMGEFPNPSAEQQLFFNVWKCNSLIQAGRLNEAEPLLRPYLEGQIPLNAQVVATLGDYIKAKGDIEIDVQLEYQRRVAATFAELHTDAMIAIIRLLIGADRATDALHEIDTLAPHESQSIAVQFLKIDALELLERFDEAMQVLDTIPGLDRASSFYRANAWCERAYILRKQERPQDAIAPLLKAREIGPEMVRPRLELASVYEKLGRRAEAYEALLDAIALQPSLAIEREKQLKELREPAEVGS